MKQPREKPLMGEVQREIMELFWQRDEAGVGEVWRTLSARRPVARNTVLTMITRLARKGWLVARREGNAFRYKAALPKERVQANEIRRLVDTVFNGSAEGLVMTLLENGGLSPEEERRIRQMILASQRKGRREKP